MDKKNIQKDLEQIAARLNVKETDATWQNLDASLKILIKLVSKYADTNLIMFVNAFRQMKDNILNCILTERSRLSGTACELLETIAKVSPKLSISVNEFFFPSVLKLCGRTNKVFVSKATKTMRALFDVIPPEQFLSELFKSSKSLSINIRLAVGDGLCLLLNSKLLVVGKLEPYASKLENELRNLSQDKGSDVRGKARDAIRLYLKLFPNRQIEFTNSLPVSVQKALVSGTPSKPIQRLPTFKRPRSMLRTSSVFSTTSTSDSCTEDKDTSMNESFCSADTSCLESEMSCDELPPKKVFHSSGSTMLSQSRSSTPVFNLSNAIKNSPLKLPSNNPSTPIRPQPRSDPFLTPAFSQSIKADPSLPLSPITAAASNSPIPSPSAPLFPTIAFSSVSLPSEAMTSSDATLSCSANNSPFVVMKENVVTMTPRSSMNVSNPPPQSKPPSTPIAKPMSTTTITNGTTTEPTLPNPFTSFSSPRTPSQFPVSTSTSSFATNLISTPRPQSTQNVTMMIMETRNSQPSVRAKAFEKLASVLPSSPTDLSGYQLSLIECHITNGLYILDSKLVSVVLANLLQMLQLHVIPPQYYEDLLARCLVIQHNSYLVSHPSITEPCLKILSHFSSSTQYIPVLLAMIPRSELKVQAKMLVLKWLSALLDQPVRSPAPSRTVQVTQLKQSLQPLLMEPILEPLLQELFSQLARFPDPVSSSSATSASPAPALSPRPAPSTPNGSYVVIQDC